MIGLVLNGVLMLLLVVALGYGVRLEKKLTALRNGQQAFAAAVGELNTAAGRAEAALANLRASGQETDLLHDRVMKAREVKGQLEALIGKADLLSVHRNGEHQSRPVADVSAVSASPKLVVTQPPLPLNVDDDGRAARMAALAERIQGMTPAVRPPAPVQAILSAMTANQSAKQSLNRARLNLDEDLFAA